MPARSVSEGWCWRCARDAEDGIQLFRVYLARPFVGASGKRTTRTVPVAVCRACVETAIAANMRLRRARQPGDLLEASQRRPRVRTAQGTYASRAAMTDGSLAAAADG